ncbi:GCN5 family acetyltransferase [Yersinia entomophaga]|uniref:GCN5 family acetyltransferase n=1 Tax=Yersinia entomophaga TaxID=935293 RepID=A0ABM6BLY5_YERET|nr:MULTISPECIES: GNAT family N-acetyltransferase [Yersinia]ANI30514.1 GCN5 family acetyltransferase [Yersinia entomophaga]OWF87286.1 GNAT family N-acetyltransferase [Yersinia entomophaga]
MSHAQIRPVEPSDYLALQQLYAHPKVYRDTLQLPLPAPDLWAKKLGTPAPGIYYYVACIDGQIAGQLSLETIQRPRRNHVATFGIAVDAGFLGQGVGSALMKTMIDLCDNWLNINRIELTVFVDNDTAVALYKKFGFEIEGTSKRYALRDGKYIDAYHMARVIDPK